MSEAEAARPAAEQHDGMTCDISEAEAARPAAEQHEGMT
jgi:hypothetical protein